MGNFEKAMEEIAKIKNEEIRKKVLRFEKFRFEDSISKNPVLGGRKYELEIIENTEDRVILIDEDNSVAIYDICNPYCVFLHDLDIKRLNDAMKNRSDKFGKR